MKTQESIKHAKKRIRNLIHYSLKTKRKLRKETNNFSNYEKNPTLKWEVGYETGYIHALRTCIEIINQEIELEEFCK